MDQDRFAFIDVEAGTLSPSRRALILASPFINDDSSIRALNPREDGDGDGDGDGKDPLDLPEALGPLDQEGETDLEGMGIDDSSLRALNPTEGGVGKDPIDLSEAFGPLDQEAEVDLEGMDLLEIAATKGIRFDPPKWHRPGGYDAKKGDTSIPLSVKKKRVLPIQQHEQAAPKAPLDLLEVFQPLSQELATKLEDFDILEIAAMKGIRFDPPRWHRPCGYDSKP